MLVKKMYLKLRTRLFGLIETDRPNLFGFAKMFTIQPYNVQQHQQIHSVQTSGARSTKIRDGNGKDDDDYRIKREPETKHSLS